MDHAAFRIKSCLYNVIKGVVIVLKALKKSIRDKICELNQSRRF